MDVRTAPDILKYARETHRKPDAFLVKRAGQWVPVSIDQFSAEVARVADWMRHRGVGRGERVLIVSESRYEWAVVDLAILSLGAISVPIFPTLPVSQIAPMARDAGAVAAFVSNLEQQEKVEAVQAAGLPLHWIWTFDREGLPGMGPRAKAGAGGAAGTAGGVADDGRGGGADRGAGGAPGADGGRRGSRGERPARARRRRDHHLHVRHDRGTEGRHADPRQFRGGSEGRDPGDAASAG